MRPPALILALLALALAGCAGGSDPAAEPEPNPPATTGDEVTEPEPEPTLPAEPSRLFTKRDLASLALQPSDAPTGMSYTKQESGPRTREDVGIILDEQIAQADELGLTAVYDATFDSTTSDLRLASRLWLFAQAAGADRWLEQSREDSTLYLEQISAPPLAESSWAAHGAIGGTEVISHGFRSGNVVVVVTFSTNTETLSESDALAVAQEAAARADALGR